MITEPKKEQSKTRFELTKTVLFCIFWIVIMVIVFALIWLMVGLFINLFSLDTSSFYYHYKTLPHKAEMPFKYVFGIMILLIPIAFITDLIKKLIK